jgi:hypothetical protein
MPYINLPLLQSQVMRCAKALRAGLCALGWLLALYGSVHAGAFRLERIVGGLSSPTCIEMAPGDPYGIYVAENVTPTNRLGRIFRHDLVARTNAVFLDLSGLIAPNAFNVLLQFTFHPQYATNGKFYVTYAFRIGSNPRVGRLEEYKVIAGVPVAQRIVFEHDLNALHAVNMPFFQPGGNPDHLFVLTGDGGPEASSTGYTADRAQNLGTTYGKLLRLDVTDGLDSYPADARKNFGIPSANTAVTNPAGRLGEVIAAGFRNPWRASFDSLIGDLYIGDNGFHTAEEQDFIKADVFYPVSVAIPDYGWPAFEGIYHPVPSANAFVTALPTSTNMILPIISRTAAVLDAGVDINFDGIPDATGDGDDSAIAGYVYRGPIAELYGKYIYGDFQAQRVYMCSFDRNLPAAAYNGTNTVTGFTNITALLESTLPGADLNNVVSFYEDAAGNLYLVDLDGEVFEVVPVPANNDFANAFVLTGAGLATNGNTLGATLELDEPAHAGNTNAPSVWFQWPAAQNGRATLALTNLSGPVFNSAIAVYTGASLAALTPVVAQAGGTNGSQVSFNCVAGEIYRVAVAGQNRTYGEFGISLEVVLAPMLTVSSTAPGEFAFQVDGTPGAVYVVEASTNLFDWVPINTNNAAFLHLDSEAQDMPHRFFRARHLP